MQSCVPDCIEHITFCKGAAKDKGWISGWACSHHGGSFSASAALDEDPASDQEMLLLMFGTATPQQSHCKTTELHLINSVGGRTDLAQDLPTARQNGSYHIWHKWQNGFYAILQLWEAIPSLAQLLHKDLDYIPKWKFWQMLLMIFTTKGSWE